MVLHQCYFPVFDDYIKLYNNVPAYKKYMLQNSKMMGHFVSNLSQIVQEKKVLIHILIHIFNFSINLFQKNLNGKRKSTTIKYIVFDFIYIKFEDEDFPGSPVVKTPHFQQRG